MLLIRAERNDDDKPTIDKVDMTQQTKAPLPKPDPRYRAPLEDVKAKKQKAEQSEIAGRHKNDGQKDHKGAR